MSLCSFQKMCLLKGTSHGRRDQRKTKRSLEVNQSELTHNHNIMRSQCV